MSKSYLEFAAEPLYWDSGKKRGRMRYKFEPVIDAADSVWRPVSGEYVVRGGIVFPGSDESNNEELDGFLCVVIADVRRRRFYVVAEGRFRSVDHIKRNDQFIREGAGNWMNALYSRWGVDMFCYSVGWEHFQRFYKEVGRSKLKIHNFGYEELWDFKKGVTGDEAEMLSMEDRFIFCEGSEVEKSLQVYIDNTKDYNGIALQALFCALAGINKELG